MSDSSRRCPFREPHLRRLPLPRYEDLCAEPQLASLAILETAIDVAILALAAAYPELASFDDDEPTEVHAALDLVDFARALASACERYRLALREARDRDQDDMLPF